MFKTQRLSIAAVIAVIALIPACNRSPEQRAAKALKSGTAFVEKKDYTRALLQFRAASKFTPKSAEPFYRAALVYLEIGDFQSAANNLMKATEIDPKYSAAQVKLAELMVLNSNLEVVQEAERRAQAALKSATTTADAINALAMAELRLGKIQSAEQHVKEALAKFPANLKSSMLLATLKLEQKDPVGAEAVLKQAVALAPKSVEPRIALGRFYRTTGDPAAEEREYRAALALDPANGMALGDFAVILIQNGRKAEAEPVLKRMSALKDKHYNAAYGEFLFMEKREAEALGEYERLYKGDTKDRAARSRLVAACVATRHIPRAEQVLTSALTDNKRDLDALLQRSELYILAGKTQLAEQDLNRVLTQRPDAGTAHYLMARVHDLQGARLNQRRELNEALRHDPTLLIARLDLAQSLISGADAKAALDLLRAAPDQQKNSLPVIVQTNWAYIAMNDREQARAGLAKGLALGQPSADLQLQQAVLYLVDNKPTEARAALDKALAIAPEDVRALDLLARSYLAAKQPADAVAKIRAYAARLPKSAPVQQYLGMLLASTGNRQEARQAFQAAKTADPSFVAADLASAQLDLAESRYDAAKLTLSNVIHSNDRNIDARLLLGMAEEASGNFTRAIDEYRKVVLAEPSNGIALNNLSYRLANNQQSDEAVKYAEQAFEQYPNNPAFEDTLGWAYYQKGIYPTAIRHLANGAKYNVPVRSYHLAMAYAKAGNKQKAREVYLSALKMNPNLPEAKLAAELVKP